MTRRTRATVAGRTLSGRFSTLETVPRATPAAAATSCMVAVWRGRGAPLVTAAPLEDDRGVRRGPRPRGRNVLVPAPAPRWFDQRRPLRALIRTTEDDPAMSAVPL